MSYLPLPPGDVYSASFAVVPHMVDALAQRSALLMFDFAGLPITIETERRDADIERPEFLEPHYSASLQRLARFADSACPGP